MAAGVKEKEDIQDEKANEAVASITPKEQKKRQDAAQKEMVKKAKRSKKDKKDKKGIGRFIPLIVVLIILGALVSVVGFDAFGLRTKYLNGILQNIPIVKNLIPVEDNIDEKYADISREDLVAQIEALTKAADEDKAEIESLTVKSNGYVEDITKLNDKIKTLENQQPDFIAQKAEFDRVIALNDPNAYAKFYETVSPQNAEILYKEAITAKQVDKDLKNYVATFKAMDETEAASVLEQMISTDIDLVDLILKNIDSETRGTIIGKMTPASAASIVKKMAPVSAVE